MKLSSLSALLLACLVSNGDSRVAFPDSLTVGADDRPGRVLRLLGVGVREKTIFRIDVYAVGLYVDTRFASTPRETLASIRAGRVDRGLRLLTMRSIDGEKMHGAFEREMRPRFLRTRTHAGLAGTDADWRTFASFFQTHRLAEGTELLFVCDARGVLESTVDGTRLAAIHSEALCYALFDVYIGPEPVSGKLKERLLSRFDGDSR